MSQVTKPQLDVEDTIISAIRQLGGTNGLSVEEIQQHVSSSLKKNLDLQSIQFCLDSAVDKGFLLKLSTGKYIINTATESADTNEVFVRCIEATQDANINACPNQEKVNVPVTKAGASVSTGKESGSIPVAQEDSIGSTTKKDECAPEAQEDADVSSIKTDEGALEPQEGTSTPPVEYENDMDYDEEYYSDDEDDSDDYDSDYSSEDDSDEDDDYDEEDDDNKDADDNGPDVKIQTTDAQKNN